MRKHAVFFADTSAEMDHALRRWEMEAVPAPVLNRLRPPRRRLLACALRVVVAATLGVWSTEVMATPPHAEDQRAMMQQNHEAGLAETVQRVRLTPGVRRFLQSGGGRGLIEVAPVHWPADNADSDCNHLGWPIATMAGDTIVLMHRRIPGHKRDGAGEPDPAMSYGVVLRSTDGGRSWSEPHDLRSSMHPDDRDRGGVVPLSHRFKFDPDNPSPRGYKVHLHAIGTLGDGAVLAINNHGVFRSDDAGQTWRHFPEALREDTFEHPLVNFGPRIIDHPEAGPLAFGNWMGAFDEPAARPALSNHFVALHAERGGASWRVEAHDVGFPQYEPAALVHDGRVLLVTRDQSDVRAHRQMTWRPGDAPAIHDTNLEDPRFVDTVDFSYNPVTERFELVRSERHRMELWLWSMDPADWDSGKWRRECRLFGVEGAFYRDADGFHPAGAVIDEARGVQHIFIYAGHPNGPAGVFRITRTLDTPALSRADDK